jgi:hypothetical protein
MHNISNGRDTEVVICLILAILMRADGHNSYLNIIIWWDNYHDGMRYTRSEKIGKPNQNLNYSESSKSKGLNNIANIGYDYLCEWGKLILVLINYSGTMNLKQTSWQHCSSWIKPEL